MHRDDRLEIKREDQPDLHGGMAYLASPRHANYVDSATLQARLAQLRDRFGWPDLDDHSFDTLVASSAVRPESEPVTTPAGVSSGAP